MSVSTASYTIVRSNQMKTNEWVNPRLFFIKSINKPLPATCPECDHLVKHEDDEIICPHCGLVCNGPIEYVGLKRITYPFRQ